MGTFEIIVVFAALMALIALVSVGIDWIGKPLKHRRFIPRMYRFEDEKLPIDAYGNVTLAPRQQLQAPPMHGLQPPAPQQIAYTQPPPVVVAHIEPRPTAVEATHRSGQDRQGTEERSDATMQVPLHELPDADGLPDAPGSTSAFSDSLAASESGQHAIAPQRAARVEPASTESPDTWHVGMTLDATINDAKPDLATKAERFWQSVAVSLTGTHFGERNLARMSDGKAPRRNNPRTGRAESMQLTGLRQASLADEVHMRWPDEDRDPWSTS